MGKVLCFFKRVNLVQSFPFLVKWCFLSRFFSLPFKRLLWLHDTFWKLETKNDFLWMPPFHSRSGSVCLSPKFSARCSSAPSEGGYLPTFCCLPLLTIRTQMVTLWYCWKKKKKAESKINNAVLLGREWELINGRGTFCFFSFWCWKKEKWEKPSYFYFVCLCFITPSISINKACFLVTDRREKKKCIC